MFENLFFKDRVHFMRTEDGPKCKCSVIRCNAHKFKMQRHLDDLKANELTDTQVARSLVHSFSLLKCCLLLSLLICKKERLELFDFNDSLDKG